MNLDWSIKSLKEFLEILRTPLFELSHTKVSLASVLFAILIFVSAIKLAKFAGIIVNRSLQKKSVDSVVRDSLEKFSRYLVIMIGMLFALDALGFTLSSLAAFGAILMVGIGFGLQNITQNFISGIILLVERPVKVGDIIQVGSASGKVLDIRVRSTVVQTRDDVSIIVPNSKLLAEEVINQSFLSNRIRRQITIGIAYGSDVSIAMQLLLDAALAQEAVLKEPPPLVIFSDFGESSLDFALRFWTTEIWDIDRLCSDIRINIESLFRSHGIQIPFPQRDLHLRSYLQS